MNVNIAIKFYILIYILITTKIINEDVFSWQIKKIQLRK